MNRPKYPIENCGLIYQCPKTWDRLATTDKPGVRFCDQCYEQVYRVNTPQELAAHAAQRHCVAIFPQQQSFLGAAIGIPLPRNLPADHTPPDEPEPPDNK